MDLRAGISATAKALGINPVDLATAISYETAGTFDPTKAGPTTQWGQHKGLIQFGEPQAEKYGVNWADPVGSQLGPNGAVANYLRDTGVKPGMGLLDIYSAINAGGVGRYNRSDANNGGAPGTVADKVNKQMAGHRANAEKMFGSAGSDVQIGQQGADTMQPEKQQLGLLGQFLPEKAQGYLTPERIARAQMAFEGMTLNPNQGVMASAQARLKDASSEKSRNKTIEWLVANGREDLAAAVGSGSIDGKTAATIALTPAKDDRTALEKNYKFFIEQGLSPQEAMNAVKSGTNVNVNTGSNGIDFGKPSDGTVWQRDAAGKVVMDERGAPIAIPYQGGPAYAKQLKSEAEATAGSIAQDAKDALSARAGGVVIEDIGRLKKVVESAPWYSPAVGLGADLMKGIGGSKAADAEALAKTVRANIGFDRLQQMRDASPTGGALGSVSEQEMATLQAVMGNLEQSQSEGQFIQNLDRMGEIYTNIMAKFAEYPNAADFGFGSTGGKPSGGATHRFNPLTNQVEAIR